MMFKEPGVTVMATVLLAVAPAKSVILKLTLVGPSETVGLPEIVPVEGFRVSPAGSEGLPWTAQMNGEVPPDSARVWL